MIYRHMKGEELDDLNLEEIRRLEKTIGKGLDRVIEMKVCCLCFLCLDWSTSREMLYWVGIFFETKCKLDYGKAIFSSLKEKRYFLIRSVMYTTSFGLFQDKKSVDEISFLKRKVRCKTLLCIKLKIISCIICAYDLN